MILSTYLNETSILEEMELNRALSESIEYEYLSEETQNGIVTKFKALVEKVRKIITQIYNKIKQKFQELRKKLPMYKKYNKEMNEILTIEVESIFDLNDPKRISGKMDYVYDEIIECVDKLKQNLDDDIINKMSRYIENDFEFLKTKLDISQEPKTYKFNAEEYIDKFRDWENLLHEQFMKFSDFSSTILKMEIKTISSMSESKKAINCISSLFNKLIYYVKELCDTLNKLVLSALDKTFVKQIN